MKKLILMVLSINLLFGAAEDLNSGEAENGALAKSEKRFYKIEALAGQSVDVVMDGLTADGDMYVKVGESPTLETFDCRSIHSGTRNEDCSVDLAEAGDVYILIYGYKATDYRIKATIEGGNNKVTLLKSGVAVNGDIAQGKTSYYKINGTKGETITTLLDGLNNDADIFVKVGSKASANEHDCKSTHGGLTADECSVILNANAEVHISVYGYKATNYQLTATGSAGNDISVLTSGEAQADSVVHQELKYYKISAEAGDKVISKIDNLNADADIYVKIGEKPTGASYDCRSTNGRTTADECSVTLDEDGDVYIGVYGYKATVYEVTATIEVEDADRLLISGEFKVGSVARAGMEYYKIHVGSKKIFSVLMNELTADADMYVQINSQPTNESYACRSLKGGTTEEECTFSINDESDIYIGIYGYRAADYKLLATVTNLVASTNMLEDAEGGQISPNWVTLKGPYTPKYFTKKNVLDPASTGIIAFRLNSGPGQLVYYTNYMLPVNDSIHKILEIDLGGFILPLAMHYAFGVEVETILGTRRMEWDSFFNHHNKGPHFGNGNWLDYPTPVENILFGNNWNHFKVDLEQQLRLLEPTNRITKVVYFFTLGGTMDNIKLSSE